MNDETNNMTCSMCALVDVNTQTDDKYCHSMQTIDYCQLQVWSREKQNVMPFSQLELSVAFIRQNERSNTSNSDATQLISKLRAFVLLEFVELWPKTAVFCSSNHQRASY